MERVLNSNGGWLNYRTSGSYAYFLIGKWRIEMVYTANIAPPAVDFRIQTR